GGFAGGGYYLYRQGVLGGSPPAPARDSAPAATRVPDSVAAQDSAVLFPELARFDTTLAQLTDTTHRPAAPPPPPPPVRTPEVPAGDSGTLRLENLPPRTQVFIDSRPVTQAGAELHLTPGWHELGVSARGFAFFTDSVQIQSGRTLVYTPVLSSTGRPTGSAGEFRRRLLARLDCDNPAPVNRFGRACYDSPPLPLGTTLVAIPAEVRGVPSAVTVIVKVSRQGRTLAVRTRIPSNEDAFTRAVESHAAAMRWTPAMRDGEPVDGWTQAAFLPASQ
ncbi:MAG TPA: hypothetical protein VNH46_12990, partial [Gemmatimonadales bacterium]|nr:hypothetical protein [Gemmatimonadales bacterium]